MSLDSPNQFAARHIGPRPAERDEMLAAIGTPTLESLLAEAIPGHIRRQAPLRLPPAESEHAYLTRLRGVAARNQVFRSFIGLGYWDTVTPAVILRNVLENPGWYTPYTPYQAEIAQGRLEGLLNFQTAVRDLTGMDVANASLLDEATAAAEAMTMAHRVGGKKAARVFVAADTCFPQTLELLASRAEPLGLTLRIQPAEAIEVDADVFGVLVQTPDADGRVLDLSALAARAHAAQAIVAVATDLLACTLITPPGEQGADIVVGSAQRFGVPLGYGGPHAAFFATRERFVRQAPGRIIGVSVDAQGSPAYRMSLQTREQHIRREKATSNICTAQALLANIAGLYAVYHGPDGLTAVARQVHGHAVSLEERLAALGYVQRNDGYFDTLSVETGGPAAAARVRAAAEAARLNFRYGPGTRVGIALDETVSGDDLDAIVAVFAAARREPSGARPDASATATAGAGSPDGTSARARATAETGAEGRSTAETGAEGRLAADTAAEARSSVEAGAEARSSVEAGAETRVGVEAGRRGASRIPPALARRTAFLTHPVFSAHRSESEMMRYIRGLERKDIGLDSSMIPLGSCTMKLNAAAEMLPITWPEFSRLHPFAPVEQAEGYQAVFRELEATLCEITGFAAVSLQPNSGAQGELAGLLVIRAWHHGRGQADRDVVLIPSSAHGTNPASAILAGMKVVVVACDAHGNVDVGDLTAKAEQHRSRLAALMVTYPSTHGVFEDAIQEVCRIVHDHGGQVYMDGANMNAQVGLTSPALIGADVCHINLHKTFAIPHGGGGPGMGPIAVAAHLAPYLPGHPLVRTGGAQATHAVSAAPWGSASILLISYGYMRMLGPDGMTDATACAILNANYLKARLEPHFPILYTRQTGRVAHEMIVDLRALKQASGIDETDVAKRLMDYGFHAPTISFPVAGTLMIEPTESEPKAELDRFCDALIAIRGEIQAVIDGEADPQDNVLKHAPHTASVATADAWPHRYSRQAAVYPLPFVRARKVWPAVGRVDNAYGDRHLVCACPSIETYAEPAAVGER